MTIQAINVNITDDFLNMLHEKNERSLPQKANQKEGTPSAKFLTKLPTLFLDLTATPIDAMISDTYYGATEAGHAFYQKAGSPGYALGAFLGAFLGLSIGSIRGSTKGLTDGLVTLAEMLFEDFVTIDPESIDILKKLFSWETETQPIQSTLNNIAEGTATLGNGVIGALCSGLAFLGLYSCIQKVSSKKSERVEIQKNFTTAEIAKKNFPDFISLSRVKEFRYKDIAKRICFINEFQIEARKLVERYNTERTQFLNASEDQKPTVQEIFSYLKENSSDTLIQYNLASYWLNATKEQKDIITKLLSNEQIPILHKALKTKLFIGPNDQDKELTNWLILIEKITSLEILLKDSLQEPTIFLCNRMIAPIMNTVIEKLKINKLVYLSIKDLLMFMNNKLLTSEEKTFMQYCIWYSIDEIRSSIDRISFLEKQSLTDKKTLFEGLSVYRDILQKLDNYPSDNTNNIITLPNITLYSDEINLDYLKETHLQEEFQYLIRELKNS